jgi:hypothetical protein
MRRRPLNIPYRFRCGIDEGIYAQGLNVRVQRMIVLLRILFLSLATLNPVEEAEGLVVEVDGVGGEADGIVDEAEGLVVEAEGVGGEADGIVIAFVFTR